MPMMLTKKLRLSSGLGVTSSRWARWARSKARWVDCTGESPEKKKGGLQRDRHRISSRSNRSAFGVGDRFQRQALLVAGVVHQLGLTRAKDHRRAAGGGKWCPFRDAGMVGTSGLRERDPGGAHLIGELLSGRADAGVDLPRLEVVEDEGNLHTVHGLQPALAD